MSWSQWTTAERQVHEEFVAGVAELVATAFGEPASLPPYRGADPMADLDIRVGNLALQNGYGLRWTAEAIVRRRLVRVYGATLVTRTTATETPRTQ